jgi:hypothetical protein
MGTPIVFLDTETTGVHPGRKVWEVAMIRRDDARAIQAETSFFVEVDLSNADPFGLSVGRFYERHPHGQQFAGMDEDLVSHEEVIEPETAAERVAAWTHGAHIVGAVPNFDTEVLGQLLREHGLIPAWHYHLIDVENLAVGYIHGRAKAEDLNPKWADQSDHAWSNARIDFGAPPWKSDELSAVIGVEPASEEERHTALGDARWAMRLYDKITGHTR